MPSLPLSLRAYRYATGALEPIAPMALRRRARLGKENPLRLSERLGIASLPRPEGTLIWIHGASVGECLAALPLIDALLATPGRSVLMTSGTVTSAEMMAKRLPPRVIHQYAPVDTPSAVTRFFDHWRPDAALFVDSEIWPNMLMTAHARGTHLAIVNGRMSEKSFSGWQRAKRSAQSLLTFYDICLAQDAETAARLASLGAPNVQVTGSLKADAPPLPVDSVALSELRRQIGSRKIFLATNTHAGEEQLLIHIHDALRQRFPDLLTVIVPRHAERGAEIAAMCGARHAARRSLDQSPYSDVEIYIGDTMGELGLFYRLAGFAFIGKSLSAHGGQNPLEAARLGVAVLAGPYTENFHDAYDAIFAAQGSGRVAHANELAALVARLLNAPDEVERLGNTAEAAVRPLGGALELTRQAIETMLNDHART